MVKRNSTPRNANSRKLQAPAIARSVFDSEFSATSKLSRAIEGMRKGATKDQSFMRLELAQRLEFMMDEYEARITAIEQRQ